MYISTMRTEEVIACLFLVSTSASVPLGGSSVEAPTIFGNVAQLQITPLLIEVPVAAVLIPSSTLIDTYGLWYSLKGLIPDEYYKTATESRLYEDSKFVTTIFNLALQQVALELETLYAKQALFKEYIRCACPINGQSSCTVQDLYNDDIDFGQLLNPYLVTMAPNMDFEIAVRILKLMKFSLAQVEQRHKHLAAIVQCSCPHSAACNKAIDNEIYHIITGAKDNYLFNAYWQGIFRGERVFPTIIPDEILIPLQTAWHNLLEKVFGHINAETPVWGLLFGQLFPNSATYNQTAVNSAFTNSTFSGNDLTSTTGSVVSSGSQVVSTASGSSTGTSQILFQGTSNTALNTGNITTSQSAETATATVILASVPITAENKINFTSTAEKVIKESLIPS